MNKVRNPVDRRFKSYLFLRKVLHMKGLQLRTGEASDNDWLYELYCRTMMPFIKAAWGWDEAFQSTGFREHLAPIDWKIIIEDGLEIGGFVVREQTDCLWLELIIIEPVYQHRGAGKAVIDFLKCKATQKSKPLKLSVMKSNPVSSFYERQGFTMYEQDEFSFKFQWCEQKH